MQTIMLMKFTTPLRIYFQFCFTHGADSHNEYLHSPPPPQSGPCKERQKTVSGHGWSVVSLLNGIKSCSYKIDLRKNYVLTCIRSLFLL